MSRASVTGCAVCNPRKSRLDTTPSSRPASSTTTWLMRRRVISRTASNAYASGGSVTKGPDMMAEAGVTAASRPSATTRARRSWSVTIPTGTPASSTTTTEPTDSRENRRATSIADTFGWHVTGGRAMRSCRWCRKSDSSPTSSVFMRASRRGPAASPPPPGASPPPGRRQCRRPPQRWRAAVRRPAPMMPRGTGWMARVAGVPQPAQHRERADQVGPRHEEGRHGLAWSIRQAGDAQGRQVAQRGHHECQPPRRREWMGMGARQHR